MKKKILFTYIILVFISLILLIIDLRLKLPLNSMVLNFFPIKTRSILNQWKEYKKLEEKNKELLKEIARLSYESQIYQSLKKENEQFRKILEFQSNFPLDIVPAEIVSKLPQMINISYIISKGSSKGIKEDDPVIGFNGVFGKVLKVGSETSIIQTLVNYNVALSAMDKRSEVKGILRWHKKFYLEGVPLYADVEKEDTIITSGIGSVFPRELRIGKVTKISRDESAYSLSIEIEPFEDFNNPDVVFLIH